jgi:hypothetical protein
VYVVPRPNVRKELFPLDEIVGPNPKCYVCAEKPEVRFQIRSDLICSQLY